MALPGFVSAGNMRIVETRELASWVESQRAHVEQRVGPRKQWTSPARR
jgi:hypothetical protein